MTAHPGPEVLLGWLESGKPARVTRHVNGCPSCLEQLDGLSDLDGGLRLGLDAASAPPQDLAHRTSHGVRDRLAAEEALSVVAELFALPWNTLSAMAHRDPAQRVVDRAASRGDDANNDREQQ